MKYVCVQKLGNYYYNKTDKNGGAAEYKIISDKIEEICKKENDLHFSRSNVAYTKKNSKKDDIVISIVVNGGNDIQCEYEMREIRKESDAVIFVATDYLLAERSKNFIEMSDYILHQAPFTANLFGKSGAYSYIPELFYNEEEEKQVSEVKAPLVFFGGNIVGREEEVDIIFDKKNDRVRNGIVAFYKEDAEHDYRVRYDEYRKIMSLFKFAYVSGRSYGSEYGWVTPRYVEAINANCIPIKIGDYDKFNYFGFQDTRANTYGGIVDVMWKYECAKLMKENDPTRNKIEFERKRIKEAKNILFEKALYKAINEAIMEAKVK